MTALGLYRHAVIARNGSSGASYFLGEHVMSDRDTPACGADAQLVAPVHHAAGFGVVCRFCLYALVESHSLLDATRHARTEPVVRPPRKRRGKP